MARLEGRVALVTGGASGIGAACCRLMAEEGASIVVVDRSDAADRAAAVVAQAEAAGAPARFEPADVTEPGAVAAVVARTAAALGVPDAVVAAAGVSRHPDQADLGDLLRLDPTHWDFVLRVNLTGVFLSIREAAAAMVDAGIPGTVVTLASVAAKIPTAGAYSVSKAGVAMLTRALAVELAPHGIRVNAVGPGYIRTPMLDDVAAKRRGSEGVSWLEERSSKVPLGRLGTPEDVAKTVVFLSSEESAYLTGGMLHPDGGYVARFAGG